MASSSKIQVAFKQDPPSQSEPPDRAPSKNEGPEEDETEPYLSSSESVGSSDPAGTRRVKLMGFDSDPEEKEAYERWLFKKRRGKRPKARIVSKGTEPTSPNGSLDTLTDLRRWKAIEVLPVPMGATTRLEGTAFNTMNGATGSGAESEEDACIKWLCMCFLHRSITEIPGDGTDGDPPAAYPGRYVDSEYQSYRMFAEDSFSMGPGHMNYGVASLPPAIRSISPTVDAVVSRRW